MLKALRGFRTSNVAISICRSSVIVDATKSFEKLSTTDHGAISECMMMLEGFEKMFTTSHGAISGTMRMLDAKKSILNEYERVYSTTCPYK